MSYLKLFFFICYRECILHYRKKFELLNPLLFFVIVTMMFPFAIIPEPKTLQTIGPGVIWVATLLSTLLSLPKLFKDDYLDGSLEQFLLSSQPLSLLIFSKIIAHWILFNFPIILISPLLALMFNLPLSALCSVILSLLLGTLLLNLMGSLGASLTIGLKNSSLLLALILLPLFVPVLIFGTSIIIATQHGLSIASQFALLGAMLVLAVTFVPLVTASILKINLSFE